jgi:monovalent cation/proton antiporter MnhG/PhaG subunit
VTARHVIAVILLWIGVGWSLVAALGVLVMRSAYDRLHFPAVATLGAVFVAAAVIVEKSFSLLGDEAALAALVLLIASPVLTHATARAVRISQHGDWRVQDQEDIEVEES